MPLKVLPGKKLPKSLYNEIAQGADEIDLVNSGLEETMITAYQEIRETRKKHKDEISLRTAAFINAINRIAGAYYELGIFP